MNKYFFIEDVVQSFFSTSPSHSFHVDLYLIGYFKHLLSIGNENVSKKVSNEFLSMLFEQEEDSQNLNFSITENNKFLFIDSKLVNEVWLKKIICIKKGIKVNAGFIKLSLGILCLRVIMDAYTIKYRQYKDVKIVINGA